MGVSDDNTEVSSFTILVAEDDEADRFFLRRAYAKSRLVHRLEFVTDGQQAIEYLKGSPPFSDHAVHPYPDLVLLDIKMPKCDGFEVLEWIKANVPNEFPVVMLTTSDMDEDRQKATEKGADDYIVKSADWHVTAEMLKEVCAKWLKEAE